MRRKQIYIMYDKPPIIWTSTQLQRLRKRKQPFDFHL